jgi:hypothetical protein
VIKRKTGLESYRLSKNLPKNAAMTTGTKIQTEISLKTLIGEIHQIVLF